MIDDKEWNYYYKLNKDGSKSESNLLYTPYINSKKTVMCMQYSQKLDYQSHKIIPEETLDYFFNREVRFLHELKNENFTPEVYNINQNERKIYIEFPGETISQIMFDPNRSLDRECSDWKEQLYNIISTLKNNNYYKLALYPHCFFVTDDKKIKTIDYYSIVPFDDRFIDRSVIEPIIGKLGEYRFDKSTDNGTVDLQKVFDITCTYHLDNYWNENPFSLFYSELFKGTHNGY